MTSTAKLHRPVLARQARYRWDALRRQHQLVFPEGMLVLNGTGAAIVQVCDGRTADEIIHALHLEFPDAAADEVEVFLRRLSQKGLLCEAMYAVHKSSDSE